MNIVFDTNVLISSTLWDESNAQGLLHKIINLKYKIFSSLEIILEYKKVLKRDFDYKDSEISHLIKYLFSFIIIIEPKIKINIIKEDPDDNKILECAIASSSDYIVTYDKHLLKLKEFQGIKIIKPEEMLKVI